MLDAYLIVLSMLLFLLVVIVKGTDVYGDVDLDVSAGVADPEVVAEVVSRSPGLILRLSFSMAPRRGPRENTFRKNSMNAKKNRRVLMRHLYRLEFSKADRVLRRRPKGPV